MRNKILTAIALVTTVAAGTFAGYKIAMLPCVLLR